MAGTQNGNIESRKEIIIPITLKGLYDGYKKIVYDAPLSAFQWAAGKVDAGSKSLMTGYAAAATMPVGIMLRNGARVAYDSSKSRYLAVADGAGIVGSAAAWWIAGSAAYTALSSSLALTSTVGAIGAGVAAAVVTSPVLVPAYTAGVLLASTALGAAATALSVIPAVANLKVAFLRSADRFRGIKHDEAALSAEHSKGSVREDYEELMFRQAMTGLGRISDERQKEIYDSLKAKFEPAAAGKKEDEAVILGIPGDVSPAADEGAKERAATPANRL